MLHLGSVLDDDEAADRVLETGGGWRTSILSMAVCDTAQEQLVLQLWNDLPDGERIRCHVPGFGMQGFLDGEVVFKAALCWHCHNISIGGRLATIGGRTFDSNSVPGRRLLNLYQSVFS